MNSFQLKFSVFNIGIVRSSVVKKANKVLSWIHTNSSNEKRMLRDVNLRIDNDFLALRQN